MEKHQYICPKCGCQQYESDRLQATGGNFAKMFDIQNKKFVTISCCNCGYTELYRQTGGEGWDLLGFLSGPLNPRAFHPPACRALQQPGIAPVRFQPMLSI